MDDDIQEIQELYKNKEQKKELKEQERVVDEEVLLFKLYEKSATISKTTESSFIYKEIKNLE